MITAIVLGSILFYATTGVVTTGVVLHKENYQPDGYDSETKQFVATAAGVFWPVTILLWMMSKGARKVQLRLDAPKLPVAKAVSK